MTESSLPFAIFGKSRETGDRFTLLWCHEDFSETAKRALESLRRVFQFRGGQNTERYDPSYAIWPTDDGVGWIAARLLDAGNDSLGRPHTLRIEAIYLRYAELPEAALFLVPENWPVSNMFLTESSQIAAPVVRSDDFSSRICEYAGQIKRPSVLRSVNESSSYRGFQVVVDENGFAKKRLEPHNAPPIETKHHMPTPKDSAHRKTRLGFIWTALAGFKIFLLGFLLGAVACGIPLYDWYREAKTAQDELLSRETGLNADIAKLEKENNDLSTSNNEANRKLGEANRWAQVCKDKDILTPNDLEKLLASKLGPNSKPQKETSPEDQFYKDLDEIESALARLRKLDLKKKPKGIFDRL
jgi:hypothetical protein